MRPSSFSRGGGGFLNGVDATITGLDFVVNPIAYEIKQGARKGEDFQPVNLVASFRVDGASEDVSKRLLVGGIADFGGVSEDGSTLDIGGGRFSTKSEAGLFVDSLFSPTGGGEGFPEDRISEDATSLNLQPVLGTRVRLVTLDALDAKGNVKKHEGTNKEGKKQIYTDKNVVVETVYEVPKAGKAPSKAVAKTSAATKGKPAKAVDVAEEAGEALRAVLAAKGGVIAKPKLRMALLTALTGKSDNRDAIIAFLGKDENLDGVEGVEYDNDAISAV